jgi:hypothetical protein
MLSLIVYLMPFFLAAVALIAAFGVYSNFRRSQTAPYFRIRRKANQAGWRWVLILIIAAAGAYAALRARAAVPTPDLTSFLPATPTAPATIGPDLLASEAIITPTAPAEAGQPPTITPTAPPEGTATPILATIESTVTPPAEAELTITEISSDISSNLTPVNPGTAFPVGTPRIYYWVTFSNMQNGISWSRVLLLDGTVVRSESESWERGTEGTAYYWFDAQGGWPAGAYEVQFYLGDQLADTATYDVIN